MFWTCQSLDLEAPPWCLAYAGCLGLRGTGQGVFWRGGVGTRLRSAGAWDPGLQVPAPGGPFPVPQCPCILLLWPLLCGLLFPGLHFDWRIPRAQTQRGPSHRSEGSHALNVDIMGLGSPFVFLVLTPRDGEFYLPALNILAPWCEKTPCVGLLSVSSHIWNSRTVCMGTKSVSIHHCCLSVIGLL